jgi:phosphatidylglycerol:prolipoprotein diacylglycerol transferase
MRPLLVSWRGFRIASYPALLYLGLVAGCFAGAAAADARGVDPDAAVVATLLLLAPALVGARLAFVGEHWRIYRSEPRRVWRRSEGGMAMFGGFALAIALSPPLLALLGLSFMQFWDAAAVTILVGMIFTRVGCLLNGCCAGRPTEGRFGVRLPDIAGNVERRLPTPLLEAMSACLLLVGAIVILRQDTFSGAVFLFALGGYGLARLALDPTRALSAGRRRPTVSQVVSGALVVTAVAAWAPQLL